jgi:hypothetical protein
MMCKIQYVKQTNDMQTIVRCNHAQLTIKFYEANINKANIE